MRSQIKPSRRQLCVGGPLKKKCQIDDLVRAVSLVTWAKPEAPDPLHLTATRRLVWGALLRESKLTVELPRAQRAVERALLDYCEANGLSYQLRYLYEPGALEEVSFWGPHMSKPYSMIKPIGAHGFVPIHVIGAGLRRGRNLGDEIKRFMGAATLPGLVLIEDDATTHVRSEITKARAPAR